MPKVNVVRSEEVRQIIKQHYPYPVDIPWATFVPRMQDAEMWLNTHHGENGMTMVDEGPAERFHTYSVDTEGLWMLRLGRFYFRDENTAFEFKMMFG
ncbi:MAG: hypothetical protein EOP83_05740 [Verrucomicrobiaceae bacterium]|nr:MAG: hypothetical protein EOP83_05740 [Verrucomicrobiaceae bacterium]